MKNLKKYLILFSFLFLFFIPKAHARIIVPALPFDETQTNYVMSYWGSVNKMYLTYCKGSNQRLTIKTSVGQNVYSTALGYCYGPNGEYYGYAYRRGLEATLTKEQINDYDFELTGEWGEELQSSSYQTPISYIPSEERLAIYSDYAYDPSNYIYDNDAVVISGNTDIYDTDYTTILLSQEDYSYSDNNDSNNCPGKTRQLLGQASNITSFNFSINGNVNYEDDSLFNGYFEIYNPSWNDTYPNLNDIAIVYHLVDSDSTIPDIDDLLFSTTKEYVLDSNNNRYLRINIAINSDVSYDTPVTVFLTVNVSFNNYDLSSVGTPYYFYSKNNVCNSTITGYGYNNNLTGLYFGSNPILENYLKDYSPAYLPPNVFTSLLPPGPIDSVLLIPVQVLDSLVSSLNSSCTPVVLPLPFVNSNLTLPCINSFYSSIGIGTFINWASMVISVLILIKYFKNLYDWVENVVTLKHQKLSVWGVD